MINNRPKKQSIGQKVPEVKVENHRPDAQIVSQLVLSQIVASAQNILKTNAFIAKYLNIYSTTKTVNNISQIESLFNFNALVELTAKQEEEPNPLYVDSLLPISADIDEDNQYKKKLKNFSTLEESSVRMRNKEQSRVTNKVGTPVKLAEEIIEEDGFTQELRKQQEQKNVKLEGERKAREKKERSRLQKQKNAKSKEEKISYDYNGKVVQVKAQNKANLISSIINGETDAKINLVKQVTNDPTPTTLEGVSHTKGKNKKMLQMASNAPSKFREQIAFSDVRSLADNYKSTTHGVKFAYEGKIIEEKKKTISTQQLRKTLSQRRLSKEEFHMLKSGIGNNREDHNENIKKSAVNTLDDKLQRTRSEAKFTESRMRKSIQFIHVNSEALKNKLLEKIRPQEPIDKKAESEIKEDQQLKLDSIDRFNMKYMTTGGSINSQTSREFYGNNIVGLPKIAHTTLSTHTKPKGRERIKDAGEIMRQMRKRFEDKLRV